MTGGADPGNLLKRRRRSNRAPDPQKSPQVTMKFFIVFALAGFNIIMSTTLHQKHLIKLRAYILSFSSIHMSLCLLLHITISFTVSFNVILWTGAAVALPSNRDDDGGIFNFLNRNNIIFTTRVFWFSTDIKTFKIAKNHHQYHFHG